MAELFEYRIVVGGFTNLADDAKKATAEIEQTDRALRKLGTAPTGGAFNALDSARAKIASRGGSSPRCRTVRST